MLFAARGRDGLFHYGDDAGPYCVAAYVVSLKGLFRPSIRLNPRGAVPLPLLCTLEFFPTRAQ